MQGAFGRNNFSKLLTNGPSVSSPCPSTKQFLQLARVRVLIEATKRHVLKHATWTVDLLLLAVQYRLKLQG